MHICAALTTVLGEGGWVVTPAVESVRAAASEHPAEVHSGRALRVTLAALQAGPVVILALLVLVLSLASDVFFSLDNFGNVLKQSAVISVLALGQLLGDPHPWDRPLGRCQPLAERSGRCDRVARPWLGRARGAGHARHRDVGRTHQRCRVRQGPASSPVHPDPGDAQCGQRVGPVSRRQQDDPGGAFVRERDRFRADRFNPRGERHRVVPDRHDRRSADGAARCCDHPATGLGPLDLCGRR